VEGITKLRVHEAIAKCRPHQFGNALNLGLYQIWWKMAGVPWGTIKGFMILHHIVIFICKQIGEKA
jgi:hypothetical protein